MCLDVNKQVNSSKTHEQLWLHVLEKAIIAQTQILYPLLLADLNYRLSDAMHLNTARIQANHEV